MRASPRKRIQISFPFHCFATLWVLSDAVLLYSPASDTIFWIGETKTAILVCTLVPNLPWTRVLQQCQMIFSPSQSKSWIKRTWLGVLRTVPHLSTCLLALRWCVTHLHTPPLSVINLKKYTDILSDILNSGLPDLHKNQRSSARSPASLSKTIITHSLMTITIMDCFIDYTTKVVLARICIIVLSIHMPVGSGAAISCLREVSDWWSAQCLKNSRKIILHLCGCVVCVCVCLSGGIYKHKALPFPRLLLH